MQKTRISEECTRDERVYCTTQRRNRRIPYNLAGSKMCSLRCSVQAPNVTEKRYAIHSAETKYLIIVRFHQKIGKARLNNKSCQSETRIWNNNTAIIYTSKFDLISNPKCRTQSNRIPCLLSRKCAFEWHSACSHWHSDFSDRHWRCVVVLPWSSANPNRGWWSK